MCYTPYEGSNMQLEDMKKQLKKLKNKNKALRNVLRGCAVALQCNLQSPGYKDERIMLKALEHAWKRVTRRSCETWRSYE
jgi:RNA:NAD 2'-phosphotransferase (TPT1/KptA family)